MTNEYGNQELHQVLLAGMIDFHALCEKHNLRYCLHGGTCLGAVRHKGFIPWDDDVDIAMLREDYDRFLKIAQNELGDGYTVQTYRTDDDMLTNVMKIRINNSGFVCCDNGKKEEVFLDVFPMSDVPNLGFLQRIQNKLSIFLNTVIYTKIGYVTPESTKAKIILVPLSKLPRRFLSNVLELVIKHFPHYKSKYVNIVATAAYCGNTGYATDLWPKQYFEERELVDFCGEQFYITRHWDAYLTRMYGDYMTPPQEKNRINKHGIQKG